MRTHLDNFVAISVQLPGPFNLQKLFAFLGLFLLLCPLALNQSYPREDAGGGGVKSGMRRPYPQHVVKCDKHQYIWNYDLTYIQLFEDIFNSFEDISNSFDDIFKCIMDM